MILLLVLRVGRPEGDDVLVGALELRVLSLARPAAHLRAYQPAGYPLLSAMTDITMRGHGLVDILPEAGVLLAFAAAFFLVGLWRFRYE